MKATSIEEGKGNLLEAQTEALVNTVNTVGVMGKGIALQFKQAFPDNFAAYEKACKKGEVVPGRMFVFVRDSLMPPRLIINFPTKRHWKGHARMEDIESGLKDLVRVIREHSVTSIAIPPLGCGLGGLQWGQVRSKIVAALGDLQGVRVVLFGPGDTPLPEAMPVATRKPSMTDKVAALLHVFRRYHIPGYKLGRIEAQKLAYFLQAAAVPLNLEFKPHTYGPYAEKLNHWLQNLEGHYVRGYGDRSRDSGLVVLDEAHPLVEEKLAENPAIQEGAARVSELITGFESPYGLELLATVHWVVHVDGVPIGDAEAVLRAVKGWNARKARVFQDEHVRIAATRIQWWSQGCS